MDANPNGKEEEKPRVRTPTCRHPTEDVTAASKPSEEAGACGGGEGPPLALSVKPVEPVKRAEEYKSSAAECEAGACGGVEGPSLLLPMPMKRSESESKSSAAFLAEGDDDSNSLYNPMRVDYETDLGMPGDEALAPVARGGKVPFQEKRLKDVPCKYHDGVSGECWKGIHCPYSHEPHTGGVFAKADPVIAFAAGNKDKVTSVTRIGPKPILCESAVLIGTVTSIVSPSEFYVTFGADPRCECTGVEEWEKVFAKLDARGGAAKKMDNYHLGFDGLELQDGLRLRLSGSAISKNAKPTSGLGAILSLPPARFTETERLHDALTMGHTYKHLQKSDYLPKVELVAVRFKMMWRRGLVLAEYPQPKGKEKELKRYRVQLIDTGDRVTVTTADMCRLPEYFGVSHAKAYKCMLFGISANLGGTWSKQAIETFTELVYERRVRVIVKESLHDDKDKSCHVIEDRPYIVKIYLDPKKKVDGICNQLPGAKLDHGHDHDLKVPVDVNRVMIDKGYGMEWNPFPHRPFVRTVMNPKSFEFLYQRVPKELPKRALEVENRRLAWHKNRVEFKKLESDSEVYSSNPSKKERVKHGKDQVKQMAKAHQDLKEMKKDFSGKVIISSEEESRSSAGGRSGPSK